MKGLLKKDFYTTWTYMKLFLILGVAFIGYYSFSNNANLFFLGYPCVIISTISSTLLLYDEREKWDVYTLCMPVSRTRAVSAKYVFSLLMIAFIVVANILFGVASMLIRQSFDFVALALNLLLVCVLSLVPVSITLPCMYKFGATKGRMVYLLVLGASCALIPIATMGGEQSVEALSMQVLVGVLAILLAVTVALFAISWLISVAVYRKKEL